MIDVIVMQWEREEKCMDRMSFGRKDREERKWKGEFIIIIKWK